MEFAVTSGSPSKNTRVPLVILLIYGLTRLFQDTDENTSDGNAQVLRRLEVDLALLPACYGMPRILAYPVGKPQAIRLKMCVSM